MINNSKYITIPETYQLKISSRHTIEECLPSYTGQGLYLVEFDNGIKIGISSKLRGRLEEYKHPWCRDIKRVKCFKTKQSRALEKLLKKTFKRYIAHKNSTEYIINCSMENILSFIKRNRYYKPNMFIKK